MKMCCVVLPRVLLLTLSFAAVVTSQTSQACLEASVALFNDQPCLDAANEIEDVMTVGAVISSEQLNYLCLTSCRDLNIRYSVDCLLRDSLDSDTLDLVCTTNSGGTCARLFATPEFESVDDAFESSGECESLNTTGTCSSGCAALFQDFIDVGGCCAIEVIDLGSTVTGLNFDSNQLLSVCSLDSPQDNSCQVVHSGGKELQAYGGLLLCAVIAAVLV